MKRKKEHQGVKPSGLTWHCLHCGHYWEGFTKVNPSMPPCCPQCRTPSWHRVPQNGPHDRNCRDCQEIILRHLKEMRRLESFATGLDDGNDQVENSVYSKSSKVLREKRKLKPEKLK